MTLVGLDARRQAKLLFGSQKGEPPAREGASHTQSQIAVDKFRLSTRAEALAVGRVRRHQARMCRRRTRLAYGKNGEIDKTVKSGGCRVPAGGCYGPGVCVGTRYRPFALRKARAALSGELPVPGKKGLPYIVPVPRPANNRVLGTENPRGNPGGHEGGLDAEGTAAAEGVVESALLPRHSRP